MNLTLSQFSGKGLSNLKITYHHGCKKKKKNYNKNFFNVYLLIDFNF